MSISAHYNISSSRIGGRIWYHEHFGVLVTSLNFLEDLVAQIYLNAAYISLLHVVQIHTKELPSVYNIPQ